MTKVEEMIAATVRCCAATYVEGSLELLDSHPELRREWDALEARVHVQATRGATLHLGVALAAYEKLVTRLGAMKLELDDAFRS